MSVRIAVFCVLVWCGHGSLGACGPGVWSAQLQLCLCPDHYGGPQCQYHSASEAVQAPDRALEQAAFNRLYTEGLGSGDGSTVSVTEDVRHFLREAIDGYGIKSMLDVPCGDLAWMPHTNLSGVYYMGADLSPFVIEHHQRKYKVSPLLGQEHVRVLVVLLCVYMCICVDRHGAQLAYGVGQNPGQNGRTIRNAETGLFSACQGRLFHLVTPQYAMPRKWLTVFFWPALAPNQH